MTKENIKLFEEILTKLTLSYSREVGCGNFGSALNIIKNIDSVRNLIKQGKEERNTIPISSNLKFGSFMSNDDYTSIDYCVDNDFDLLVYNSKQKSMARKKIDEEYKDKEVNVISASDIEAGRAYRTNKSKYLVLDPRCIEYTTYLLKEENPKVNCECIVLSMK